MYLYGSADLGISDVRRDAELDQQGQGLRGAAPYQGPHDQTLHLPYAAHRRNIDSAAVKQLKAVVTLPGVRHAVGRPNLSPFPVTCAVAVDGLYAALIASDMTLHCTVTCSRRGRATATRGARATASRTCRYRMRTSEGRRVQPFAEL